MKLIFLISLVLLTSCLPFEPQKGVVIWYNFCRNSISLEKEISEESSKTNLMIRSGENEAGFFVIQDEIKLDNSNTYFYENGIKKKFHFEQYKEYRHNFIACPENAKPTGDGNWIKVNY